MTDIVSKEVRSRMMAGIKGKDTKPEILVRQLLHRNGFRFRLHQKHLPGRPDIVLKRYNAVIFVNGCFWHGHQRCHLFRLPKSRRDFWEDKISANRERDGRKRKALLELGWRVGVIWECAIKGKTALDHTKLMAELLGFIQGDERSFDLTGTHL